MLPESFAWFDGVLALDPVDCSTDLSALDSPGFWTCVVTFEGQVECRRFAKTVPAPYPAQSWPGLPADVGWASSLAQGQYEAACQRVREYIAAGSVYQANICRVLSRPFAEGRSLAGLGSALLAQHDAPYAGGIHVEATQVVCASPELYLRVNADELTSGPIKGTARTPDGLSEKDIAENVMICDLVRNDLAVISEPGSVAVPALCAVEQHPGLVHLVSTVTSVRLSGASNADVVQATFPPGSVSGAPKRAALDIIGELEPVPRGPYCGAIGYFSNGVDHSTEGALAVGIRSFWAEDGLLKFGTGAGITYDSDPAAEWLETELKAERLVALAQRPHSAAGAQSP